MEKRNFLFFIMVLFLLAGCCLSCKKACEKASERSRHTERTDARSADDSIITNSDTLFYTSMCRKGDLIVYTPNFNRIDLVCGNMPDKKDSAVIFCAEAAFTGELQNDFRHSNIAGNHVSGGTLYKGFRCKRNTGAFVWYKGQYGFFHDNFADKLKNAADNGGMAFAQELMIHNGRRVKTIRKAANTNEFRALCELSGKLCIIDSYGSMRFGDFIDRLVELGVSEALYLDMGLGWNYSWWRSKDGKVHEIHNRKISYTTNWITFYK